MANPDFDRLRTALLRQGEPDRVPMHDTVDVFLKRRFLGRESVELARATNRMQTGARLPLELEVEFAYRAGYDFVPLGASIHSRITGTSTVLQAKYAAFGDEYEERGWANEGRGIITNREEFERFPWPDPDEFDFSAFAEVGRLLPRGMKVLVDHGKVFTGVWWLKARIDQIAPGGGYVLGSANSVPEYVPLENFNAMREACLRYGRYPIGGRA